MKMFVKFFTLSIMFLACGAHAFSISAYLRASVGDEGFKPSIWYLIGEFYILQNYCLATFAVLIRSRNLRRYALMANFIALLVYIGQYALCYSGRYYMMGVLLRPGLFHFFSNLCIFGGILFSHGCHSSQETPTESVMLTSDVLERQGSGLNDSDGPQSTLHSE